MPFATGHLTGRILLRYNNHIFVYDVYACEAMFGSNDDLQGTWAARYNTWLLIKLTPKGVV